jgi:hypothetical protein
MDSMTTRVCATLLGLLLAHTGFAQMTRVTVPATPATTPACAVAPPGIVGWWPGDGNANDIIAGNNGTIVGTVSFAPGEVGEAFGFAGNGYVEVPSTAALDPQQVSVAAWVSATSSVGRYAYVLANGPTAEASNYALYTGLTGGLFFYIETSDGLVFSPDGGASLWDGSFHYVVGTFDGSARSGCTWTGCKLVTVSQADLSIITTRTRCPSAPPSASPALIGLA